VSAKQGHIPAFFGKVSPSRQTPQTAILLLAILSIIMIVPGTFKTLVNFYSVCAWLFYFLAVLALIVLRFKEPELKRPYKTWLSTPILFCTIAIFLFVMPFVEAPWESFAALGFTALGVPVWLLRVKYGASVERFWEGKQFKGPLVYVLSFLSLTYDLQLWLQD
jgi:amino acid transporter